MRTKRIKAANVRIGDVVYGVGTVSTISHLNREMVDIYVSSSDGEYADRLTRYFDDLIEIVTHNNNPVGN